MIWVIPLAEIERFNKDKVMSSTLEACWETLLKELPHELINEISQKGLEKIEFHPINKELKESKYKVMKFVVPNASKELEERLGDNENTILCE